MLQQLNKLYSNLGYKFANKDLLINALTHKSYGKEHNERLEFLGDSILNCIVASILFKKFDALDEGKLTRLRANLVNKRTLISLAHDLGLQQYMRTGSSYAAQQQISKSIIADAVEAVIAAIYLDSSWSITFDVVSRWYTSYTTTINTDNLKDYKTQLQELLQSHKKNMPRYVVLEQQGKDHQPVFTVACEVDLLESQVTATGSSKNIAAQKAAQKVLELIQQNKN